MVGLQTSLEIRCPPVNLKKTTDTLPFHNEDWGKKVAVPGNSSQGTAKHLEDLLRGYVEMSLATSIAIVFWIKQEIEAHQGQEVTRGWRGSV